MSSEQTLGSRETAVALGLKPGEFKRSLSQRLFKFLILQPGVSFAVAAFSIDLVKQEIDHIAAQRADGQAVVLQRSRKKYLRSRLAEWANGMALARTWPLGAHSNAPYRDKTTDPDFAPDVKEAPSPKDNQKPRKPKF